MPTHQGEVNGACFKFCTNTAGNSECGLNSEPQDVDEIRNRKDAFEDPLPLLILQHSLQISLSGSSVKFIE